MGDQAANPLKLFLGGLSYDSTEETIVNYFAEKYGADKVSEAQVVRDRLTSQSRGFGFVTFTDEEVARQVQTSEHMIDGASHMPPYTKCLEMRVEQCHRLQLYVA
eukprot:6203130-Pleurochrysis_carterae.AAC.3